MKIWSQRQGSFWQSDWVAAAAALLPVNLAPSLLVTLAGSVGWWRRWLPDPLARLVLGLCLWLGFVTVLATDWQASLLGLFNYLPFLGFFLAFQQALRSGRSRLAVALVAGSLWVSGLGLGQQFLGWRWVWQWGPWRILELPQADRPTSIFPSANILAVYLVVTLCLAVGLWLAGQSRTLALMALGLGLPLLILTASRNGWAMAALAVMVFLLVRRHWLWLGGLAALSLLPLGAALNWLGLRAVVPAFVWRRLADTFDPQASFFSSTANRLDAWGFALHMIGQRPLTGWGWQSFPRLYNGQDPPPPEVLNHCHNLYLSLAAEGGIPVLVAFVAIWAWACWRGWRAWQRCADPLVLCLNLALLSYFGSGLLDVVFFDGRINLLIWILLGAASATGLEALPKQNQSETRGYYASKE